MQGAFTQRLGFNSYILLWYIIVLQPKEESLEPCLIELPQSVFSCLFLDFTMTLF